MCRINPANSDLFTDNQDLEKEEAKKVAWIKNEFSNSLTI